VVSPLISVVICTYNRATLLQMAVNSVLVQNINPEKYEILVIDNCSTDNTRSVIEQLIAHNNQIRYIFEENQGLSYARNRGWREARGQYVAYLDDDAKVPPEWLRVAEEICLNIKPAVFGGPYYAFYNNSKPKWFKDDYGSSVHGYVARSLRNDEYVSGGNMFIRRDLLLQLDGFRSNLGMKGKKKGYGEETNFFIRLRSTIKDSVVFYDPKVFIYHLVRPEKFRLNHIISSSFVGGGQYYTVLEKEYFPHILPTVLIILGLLLHIFKSLTWDILLRDQQEYPFPQNYIYECTSMLFFELGYQVACLRNCKELF
jgi:glucosyl-dolichyl phosphate glucuronosyltransferase